MHRLFIALIPLLSLACVNRGLQLQPADTLLEPIHQPAVVLDEALQHETLVP